MRIFSLKISYSTTSPGHVTWIGQERLLYKEIDFTMGKFYNFVHRLVGAARELIAGSAYYMARGQSRLAGRLDCPGTCCRPSIYYPGGGQPQQDPEGFHASNNIKIIYRYLPREVRELVVYCHVEEQEIATMEANKDPNRIGSIADKQARYTPHVAGIVYSREITEHAMVVVVTSHEYRAGIVADNWPGNCILRGAGTSYQGYPGYKNKATIILVTPESTENPDFYIFLNQQRFMRRLDRIIINKCHVILN
ncbi:uncharacterized protein BDV17DRAFT_285799 [Aspergillus undulatus]|uniref:uncharacterized protein n=1 Tax=Aspergillus undulatus TaxID=1810928 RepID=UPI003CCDC029